MWRMRAGECSFYRLDERAERHGQRTVEVVLQTASGMGEGVALFRRSLRSSWWSWRREWGSGGGQHRAVAGGTADGNRTVASAL